MSELKNTNWEFKTIGEEIAAASKDNIKGKYFIITGTTAGLGLENARLIIKYGGILTCACRGTAQMEEEIAKWKVTYPELQAYVIKLDLTEFKSIREFVSEYKEKVGKLDVLINNAGVMHCPYSLTKDGYEMQIGTNHLGHYLLTALLKDLLFQSVCARVVNVSSLAHRAATKGIRFDDLLWKAESYDTNYAYGQSKIANIYFSRTLSKKWGDKVLCYSMHPGVIRTNLSRHYNDCVKCMFPCVLLMLGFKEKTIPEGVSTQMVCAVSEQVKSEPNGSYFSDCQRVDTLVPLTDEQEEKLYNWSKECTGEDL